MTQRGVPGETESWDVPTEVWFLRPAIETADQREHTAAIGAAVADLDDVNVERISTTRHVGFEGRELHLLNPEDLYKLYVRCHKAHVWVLATAGIHIRVDPSVAPVKKNVMPLSQVVRFKAAGYCEISRSEEIPNFFARLSQSRHVGPTDTHDPRCLPLHCFDPTNTNDLTTDTGRKAFKIKFHRKSQRNAGNCLVDPAGREWQVDSHAMHGADLLHVRGLHLPNGFHWDVQTSVRRMVFTNGWDVWETVNEHHLNVYPDGGVRAQHAERVWPRKPKGNKTQRLRKR